MAKNRIFLVAAIFLVLIIRVFAVEDDIKKIKSILNDDKPEVEKVVKKEGKKEIYYFLVNKGRPDMKYMIFSDAISTTKEGMNGKVPLIIIADKELKIIEVLIEKNSETAVQIERIKKNRYVSKVKESVNNRLEKIDAVAGATYTSKAIFEGVKDSINKIKRIK